MKDQERQCKNVIHANVLYALGHKDLEFLSISKQCVFFLELSMVKKYILTPFSCDWILQR